MNFEEFSSKCPSKDDDFCMISPVRKFGNLCYCYDKYCPVYPLQMQIDELKKQIRDFKKGFEYTYKYSTIIPQEDD